METSHNVMAPKGSVIGRIFKIIRRAALAARAGLTEPFLGLIELPMQPEPLRANGMNWGDAGKLALSSDAARTTDHLMLEKYRDCS